MAGDAGQTAAKPTLETLFAGIKAKRQEVNTATGNEVAAEQEIRDAEKRLTTAQEAGKAAEANKATSVDAYNAQIDTTIEALREAKILP